MQHAEVRIGDWVVMVGEPVAGSPPMPSTLYVYVADCDATSAEALRSGAHPLRRPEPFAHGDRGGAFRDAQGNVWWAVTHRGDLP